MRGQRAEAARPTLAIPTWPSPWPFLCSGADLLAVNSDGNMPYDLCEDEPTLDVIETCMAYQGITQEKINEMRAAPEQQMIADIHCMIAAGQDLDWVDAQGATLVRIGAKTKTS